MEPGEIEVMVEKTLFHRFRKELYTHLTNRADATLDLIDTLSTAHRARSVAELSLSPVFQRGHSSLYAVVREFALPERVWERLWGLVVSSWLGDQDILVLSVDATPHPRPWAETLEDRSMIYQPTPVRGNRPVGIGHRYSVVFAHPPRQKGDPAWAPPLDVVRIPAAEDGEVWGARQVVKVVQGLKAQGVLAPRQVVLVMGDSKYSPPKVVDILSECEPVVVLTRLRSNRVFYRRLERPTPPRPRGRPQRYGAPLRLNQPQLAPDQEVTIPDPAGKGTWVIRLWHNMVARGRADHPVTLVQVVLLDAEGQPVHRRPLWLQVSGPRREAFQPAWALSYLQRFDGEHTLRFLKGRLLVTAFQTPRAKGEENFWRLAVLAYNQLWLARELAPAGRYPWQKHLPAKAAGPGDVQRGMGGFLAQLDIRSRAPKRRGKSPGWTKGRTRKRRPRREVLRKGSSQPAQPSPSP
jgi:hypothetical protein